METEVQPKRRGRPPKEKPFVTQPKEDSNAEGNRISAPEKKEEKVIDKHQERIDRLSQKPVIHSPPPQGKAEIPIHDPYLQKPFEAPDGTILIGDINADYMPYRLKNGQIIRINPLRKSLSAEEVFIKETARLKREGKL